MTIHIFIPLHQGYIQDIMELIFAHQIGFSQLKNRIFDYFIAASGFENRCTYLIDNIKVKAKEKIVISFDDNRELLYREKNDRRFRDEGFLSVEESARADERIKELLDNICISSRGYSRVSLLIDYSCMSKIWYSGILSYFISNEPYLDHLEIYFSYTSAVFSEPLKPEKNLFLKTPMQLLGPYWPCGKPLALVLGLGYEKLLTAKVLHRLNYKEIYAFYSDPAFDSRYAERVVRNNRRILRKIPEGHILKYPVEDLKKTDSLLTSLTMMLRLQFQVAILPVGPKPFTFSSLLLAARYPDIAVWSIDTGCSPAAYNRNPVGEPMVCKVLFSNEDDKYL